MKPGHAETRTRDHRRNGTTCLLAAPAVATGKVVGRMTERHRPAEFTAFPGHVAEGTGPGTPVHVIPGNVSSHRSAEVHEWLRDRPDWKFHFTPTPASWTDAGGGFLSRLTGQRLKGAVFDSPAGCVSAVEGYIGHHNASDARPFRWSRSPEDPVASCRRGHRRLGEMAEAESPAGMKYLMICFGQTTRKLLLAWAVTVPPPWEKVWP